MNHELTPKEQKVIQLISEGLSNKEIAEILGIEEMTVKIHINHILNKLELRSRSQIVIYYYKNLLQKNINTQN